MGANGYHSEREFLIPHIGVRAHYCFNHAIAMRLIRTGSSARSGKARRGGDGPCADASRTAFWGDQPAAMAQKTRVTMRFASMRVVVAAVASTAMLFFTSNSTFAQSADAKPGPQRVQAEGDGQKKIDEFAEAAKVLGGPAANPECVWLGRRAVSLLWRDDLDTAFRHLDLYDRFGCPSGHIQATFRCLVRQGSIDPKQPDALSARIHGCWINPSMEAGTPSAAAPSATTNR
jgi:hypothetical protein